MPGIFSLRRPKRENDPPSGFDEVDLGPTTRSQQVPPLRERLRGFLHQKVGSKLGSRIGALAGLTVVVIIIVAAVVSARRRAAQPYPNYSKLKYKLAETYEGEGFFDKFNFFTGSDPSQGFVHYVPETHARDMNLTFASPSAAILRVDTSIGPSSVPDASTGRFSVRVESKASYNGGLFIFDVAHAPLGCGTWPALWLADTMSWPMNGEIDVLEATNLGTPGNLMTLHTTKGCNMTGVRRKQTDQAMQEDCDAAVNYNTGCGVQNGRDSFGQGFNAAGGGVVALEWRGEGIRLWQFARAAVPDNIVKQTPDPSSWGTATADFPSTSCDIGRYFKNNSIILNIDLCGPLVENVWKNSTCPSNCTDIVANRPEHFLEAYWEVKSFQIYQPS